MQIGDGVKIEMGEALEEESTAAEVGCWIIGKQTFRVETRREGRLQNDQTDAMSGSVTRPTVSESDTLKRHFEEDRLESHHHTMSCLGKKVQETMTEKFQAKEFSGQVVYTDKKLQQHAWSTLERQIPTFLQHPCLFKRIFELPGQLWRGKIQGCSAPLPLRAHLPFLHLNSERPTTSKSFTHHVELPTVFHRFCHHAA